MKASVISGLRLETDLAGALCLYAEDMAETHTNEDGSPAKPNVAAAARDLIRRGLLATRGRHRPFCEIEGYFKGIADAKRKITDALVHE